MITKQGWRASSRFEIFPTVFAHFLMSFYNTYNTFDYTLLESALLWHLRVNVHEMRI